MQGFSKAGYQGMKGLTGYQGFNNAKGWYQALTELKLDIKT